MRLYETNHDYIIYEYEENEFFEWEKDVKLCKHFGILLDSYKLYGRPLYYVIVDFRKWDYSQDIEPLKAGLNILANTKPLEKEMKSI
jgi:hypothetical protein